jgi:hypothetical protein
VDAVVGPVAAPEAMEERHGPVDLKQLLFGLTVTAGGR